VTSLFILFNMKKKSLILIAILMLAAMTGCKSAPQNKAHAFDSNETIHFGYIATDQLHSPAVMIMKEKKLLEQAGFNVVWHEYIAGAHALQEMAAGAIDFANCGVVPVIINHSQGMELAILSGSNQEGSSLVVSKSIKSINDLDGKTIATPGLGSIQDAMITLIAMENDITIQLTTMEVADMPFFLEKNEIDGFIAWAPHPAIAVSKKAGHELLCSRDMMPNHQCCVLVTKAETLRDNPKIAEKVLSVYLDAFKWFLENQEESIKIMVSATGASETVIRNAITTVNYIYPPYCNVESMEHIARGLIGAGRITTTEAELGGFFEGLYYPRLLEEVLEQSGLDR